MSLLRSALLFSCVPVLIVACSPPIATPDARDVAVDAVTEIATADVMADAPTCRVDLDCTDHVFCNGAERCAPGTAGADARGCAAASPANPCATGQTCDESGQRCTGSCPDADGDGHHAISCGGDDCDDTDAQRFPGNPETCDAAGHDEDCNPCSIAGASPDGDADHDSFVSTSCYNTYAGPTPTCDPLRALIDARHTRVTGSDCDDTDNNVRPNQSEICDGIDNNCNGMIDEMDPGGGGTCGTGLLGACAAGINHCTSGALTCQALQMSMPETCNGIDDDCNGTVDDLPSLSCGLPASQCFNTVAACNAGAPQTCVPHPSSTETCDGRDNDCDGVIDNGWPRSCYDGAAGTAGVGPCHAGTQTCTSGTMSGCAGEITPAAADTCAVPDGNCNGVLYEGLACAGGTTRPCCGIGTQSCNVSTCTWSACPPTGYTHTWGANDPSMTHVCGAVGNTGSNWEVTSATGTPGCVMAQGPGISLPPGSYSLSISAYCWTDSGATPCIFQYPIPDSTMWGSGSGSATTSFSSTSNFTVPAGSCQTIRVPISWAAGHMNLNSLTITAL